MGATRAETIRYWERVKTRKFNEELLNRRGISKERLGIYKLHEVLPFVFYYEDFNCKNTEKKEYEGHSVWMHSQSYQLFDKKGTVCKNCGLEGIYFALERFKDAKKPHFNLYGKDPKGNETMLTKDHIIPKSKGGLNAMCNYQVLCEKCNFTKGDTMRNREKNQSEQKTLLEKVRGYTTKCDHIIGRWMK